MLTSSNLMPNIQYSQSEVLQFFTMGATGLAGQFVSVVTGNQNPENADGYTSNNVGAGYVNITSNRYAVNRTVLPSAAGDTKYNCVGVTLMTTAEFDENGNKLVLQPDYYAEERGFVTSGQAVPILSRGIVMLKQNCYVGTPIPGYVGLITGGGQILVQNPATLPHNTGLFVDFHDSIAGRFLSTTGFNFGGYAQFKLEL